MKEEEIKWEKDGTIIVQRILRCDCGGLVKEVAYMSCVHEDFGSYLVQCYSCKKVAQYERLPHNMTEDFAKHGFKQIANHG